MKNYILFDNDGVLVETEHLYFDVTQRALAEIGIELALELYLKRMAQGLSSWDLAAEAGIDEATIHATRERRNACYQHVLKTEDINIDGVHETLQVLRPHYGMAVVTASKRADFETIHQGRGITDHMDFWLTQGDYERSKPHPDPYLVGLDRFGAHPHEAVVVEDSERGLRSAIAAGIDCILIRNEFTAAQDLSGAAFYVDSFRELPEAIAALAR